MATIGGPNTEKDNLVFGYDTGYGVADKDTSTRFYPGKPTANIVPDAYTMSGWGNYSAGNDGTFITEFGTTGYKVRNKNTWNGITKGITLPSTGTYTISAWFRIWGKSSGNNGINVYTNGGGLSDTAQGGDDTRIGEWQRISMTRTYTTTSITFFIISWGGTSGTDWSSWDVTMPQIEKQSTQSPFLTGTRSSTQSLIDLKRTTDIDVSNISFDSTGQPTFDGTDDGINLGDNSLFDFTNGVATIEAVVKFPSSWTGGSQYPNLISKGGSAGWDTAGWALYGFRDWPNSGQKSWGFAMRNGSTVRNTYIGNRDVDKYLHIVAAIDGDNIRLYENGVQVATQSQTINPESNTTNVYIGRGPSSQYFPGDIPISKVYNRTLSADEIKQNYNAYKNRFDI